MRLRMVMVLLLLATPTPALPMDAVTEGRRMTELFWAAEIDDLWNRFNDEMRDSMKGGKEQLRFFQLTTHARLGKETEILDEMVTESDGYRIYVRMANYEKYSGMMITQWAFDEGGRVGGFFIRPPQREAPSSNLDYQTMARLRLPVEGAWYVLWGGRLLADNYHAITVDQRFAMDLLVMRGMSTHVSQGEKNQDYYAWGRRILAPGDGVVVAMVDSLPDNKPGVMNPLHPLGNHVIIDHGNEEYSFLGHMQQGSVRVAAGDSVQAGGFLGLCGNSGNSSEPHLHYHLQDTPRFMEGDGLPAQFEGFLADGERVERGEPRRSQTVEPAP